MTAPWAAPVYATDKRTAAICTQMQRNGMAFDRERAQALSEHLERLELAAHARADAAVGREIPRGRFGALGSNGLQWAFFDQLRAPIYWRSALTGKPSLGVDSLRAYAACARPELRQLALAVLDGRRARKVRSTYIDRVTRDFLSPAGRVHPTWQTSGAVTGRLSCRDPNLMNTPRLTNDPTAASGGIRSLYVAPPGRLLAGFDASQLEMRIAAYASGDEAMIAACESSDLHSANARIIFGSAFDNAAHAERKALRSMAKNAGFAVCYMAAAQTVYSRLLADGQQVKLVQCEALLRKLHSAFLGYYRWQDRQLMSCVRTGYVETPILGRRRQLGHYPSPTECANFPIQGGAADVMNAKLDTIERGVARRFPGALIVAQVHDSVTFECDEGQADDLLGYCEAVFSEPVTIGSREARFPIETEKGARWT